ncbi:steroidogenic acute regulatory protein, mitochondrial-like isoform X2 [Rhinatrema bivittatum]|uniref:steroidogenic acute regulatory protein, mitochondrial-like isoform X2 n=1 Tax=Rhinatrema bivittatum TaxID=194408 RepID=UPI0011299AB8|nr:steroidogenic acute regulatory protein, mitochondrial-like isoform X2 [Rhinatrema bivittatum]
MLPATFKLCCGISHEHLRQMTGMDQVDRLDSHWVPSSADLSYVKQGESTLHCAVGILQQQDGWQVEIFQESGILVQSKFLPSLGKVFRAEAVVDFPVDRLHSHLFEKVEEMNDWNHISQREVLQRIGKDTLVTHDIVQCPGNLIGQRDFVSVHHSKRRGSALFLVGTATCSDLMPPQKGSIRAETGLTCIVLKPLESDKKKTKFTWLLSTDLKGWIPKSVVSYATSQSQVDFINHLQQHLAISAAQA